VRRSTQAEFLTSRLSLTLQNYSPPLTSLALSYPSLITPPTAHCRFVILRAHNGLTMPEPKYERYQINALEASAETNLLWEGREWEKHAARSDFEINWAGSGSCAKDRVRPSSRTSKGTITAFSRKSKVASLHPGNLKPPGCVKSKHAT